MTTTTKTIMFGLCGFVIVACCITAVMSVPTTYDQKQTGDLNVQIDLKDVRVVALLNSQILEDYTDYDYLYDYADFTIKPPGGKPSTTSSTTRTTEKYDATEVSPSPSQNSTVSASPDDTTNSTIYEETSNVNPSSDIASNSTNVDDDDENQSSEDDEFGLAVVASSTTASSSTVPEASRSRKRCRSGYVPDGNGRCRRANRRWLSLLP